MGERDEGLLVTTWFNLGEIHTHMIFPPSMCLSLLMLGVHNYNLFFGTNAEDFSVYNLTLKRHFFPFLKACVKSYTCI